MANSNRSKDKGSFIRKPEYPGGREALQAFIRKHLVYPKAALKHRVEGTVYLSYQVDHTGKVRDIQILKSLGHGCDEEAVRIVGLLEFSPQKNRGSRVSVKRKIKIRFKLPKEKKAEKAGKPSGTGTPRFRYSYKESRPGDSGGTVYSYSINLRKSDKPKKG